LWNLAIFSDLSDTGMNQTITYTVDTFDELSVNINYVLMVDQRIDVSEQSNGDGPIDDFTPLTRFMQVENLKYEK
jgi:predicted porin